MVRTAAEVKASISAHQGKQTKERTEFRKKQAELERYQDLRDDVMSLVRNSGMSFETIHGHCGPCVKTLEKWDAKQVDQPRLGKMRATLRIIGFDIGIVERGATVTALRKESAA